VKVSHAGFATITETAQVSSGLAATVTLSLKVSSTSEHVVVEAQAVQINTVNLQFQDTVETKPSKTCLWSRLIGWSLPLVEI
jgi:hypothetical protein